MCGKCAANIKQSLRDVSSKARGKDRGNVLANV
jgi:hypothetical protein